MKHLVIGMVAAALLGGVSLEAANAGPVTGAAVGAGSGALVAGPPGAVIGGAVGAVVGSRHHVRRKVCSYRHHRRHCYWR